MVKEKETEKNDASSKKQIKNYILEENKMKNLEVIKSDRENLAINIDEKELNLLKIIAKDANQNFVLLSPEGVVIGEEVHPQIYCQIVNIDKYHYQWAEGKIKEIKHGLGKEEARQLDFLDGADLTLKLITPNRDDAFILSCPQSSYWNLAKFVKHLLQKNLAPQQVVTRIKVLIRQFKIGKPVPTATFEAVGPYNETPNIVDAEVISPEKEISGPPSEIESKQELPNGWAD